MRPRFFPTPAALRAWFERHHGTETELLVGYHKKSTGRPSVTWPESVDEALCFGWIDGVRRSLDAESYVIRFTPRRPTSIWSAINVAKVEALREAGRMRPAGEAAYAHRTPEKTGVYAFERNDRAVLPPELEATLRADAKAAAWFYAQPPGYRKVAIHWVISARKEETRARRLSTLIADSAAGRAIKPLRRP